MHKAEGRATHEVFVEHFELTPPEIRADVVIGDNEQGVKTVMGHPGAIGYVSIGTVLARERDDKPRVRLLALGDERPSLATLSSGGLPMSRPLMLVTRPTPDPRAQRFLAYVRSPRNHDLIGRFAFVPVP